MILINIYDQIMNNAYSICDLIMLVLGIFSLMTAVALPNVNISPVFLTRVASIVLLYTAALSYNSLDIQAIGSGVGIYSGLFQVSSVSQSTDTFIFLVGAMILLPWAPVTKTIMDRSLSAFSTVPTIAEYPLMILFTTCVRFLVSCTVYSINIATLTMAITLFVLKSSIILNSTSLLALTLFHQ